LIHWNAAEAQEPAARLRRARHRVDVHAPQGIPGVRALAADPPQIFVIDLNRRPSDGLAVGVALRQNPATRSIPVVFAGGDPGKVARIRGLLPDATYTGWSAIRRALQQAARPTAEPPIVPGTMDAYSGTPLPKKLGIRGGAAVALLGAPAGFRRTLGGLPENVRLQSRPRDADVIILFAKSRADLGRRLPSLARTLANGSRLWIAWRKQTSGLATDATERTVRAAGLGAGLVDYKICAIDGMWSGLCFTRRRVRPGSPR